MKTGQTGLIRILLRVFLLLLLSQAVGYLLFSCFSSFDLVNKTENIGAIQPNVLLGTCKQ